MDTLKQFGLTGYEIKLYTTLISYGSLSASQLSEYSEVPKTAVYPHVNSLIKMGLVQQLDGETKTFVATSPRVGLKALLDSKHRELEIAQKAAVDELRSLRESKMIAKRREPVQLSKGSSASRAITLKYFETAKKFVNILGWRYMYHDKARTHIHPKLLELSKKIKVRLIVTSPSPNMQEYVRSLLKHNIDVRHYPIKNFSLVIRDGEACKLTLRPIGLEHEKTNIRISDSDLAGFMNDYYMTIWKKAKKIIV